MTDWIPMSKGEPKEYGLYWVTFQAEMRITVEATYKRFEEGGSPQWYWYHDRAYPIKDTSRIIAYKPMKVPEPYEGKK